MERHEIKLQYPVVHAGQTVDALQLRRPKVRDIKKMSRAKGDDIDKSIAMLADLAEVDPQLFEELDPMDFAAVNDWLEPILDPKARSGTSTN